MFCPALVCPPNDGYSQPITARDGYKKSFGVYKKKYGIRIIIPLMLIKPKRINSGQRLLPKKCELKVGRMGSDCLCSKGRVFSWCFGLIFWFHF
jgi:hypothetical protein